MSKRQSPATIFLSKGLQSPDDHFQSRFPEELNFKALSLATKNFLAVSWNITWSHFAERASLAQHNIKYWIFSAYWKAATTDCRWLQPWRIRLFWKSKYMYPYSMQHKVARKMKTGKSFQLWRLPKGSADWRHYLKIKRQSLRKTPTVDRNWHWE